MYVLLIAVAACIGILIYASCSADEDYDGYASKDELFTLADGEMSLRSDVGSYLPFPTVDEILANQAVRDTMLMIWEETKSLATNTQRQELGVFIRYDRTTGQYSFGQIRYGKPVNCHQRGEISVTPDYWNDRCAFFHTHTTLQYCVGWSRTTNPSTNDSNYGNTLGIPGIVYDYDIDVLQGGMSKDMAWKEKKYGPNRRTN